MNDLIMLKFAVYCLRERVGLANNIYLCSRIDVHDGKSYTVVYIRCCRLYTKAIPIIEIPNLQILLCFYLILYL